MSTLTKSHGWQKRTDMATFHVEIEISARVTYVVDGEDVTDALENLYSSGERVDDGSFGNFSDDPLAQDGRIMSVIQQD
jgi:hypothetical protein